MEMTGKENKYDAFAVKNQNGSFIVFEKTNKAMECMDISMFHCFDSLSNPI